MASVQDVAALAFSVASGCSKILETLLCFLGGEAPRSPAVDEAASLHLVLLPIALIAGVVLSYIHLTAPVQGPAAAAAAASATAMSFADLGRFIVMVFTLVFEWLLVIAVFLAFYFVFLIAGNRGIRPGFSWSVLS